MTQFALDLAFDEGADPTYGVRELADAVNHVLRRGFHDGVWVRGEIEGLAQRNGHVYLNLTERTDEGRATIAAVVFANTWFHVRGLLRRHRLTLADGLAVRVHGRLQFYAPNGRLSLVVDGLDVRFTLGALAAHRDEVLGRLAADGLLAANAARPLAAVPLRVGLVTSRGSAAWHDVTQELAASGFAFRVAACDVRVQGGDAPAAIAAAVRTLSRRSLDAILVVRGGGSRTDLAAFDDEAVARAVAESPVPVITGLGHETDRAVTDEVAHTAAKTPTAAAAVVVTRVQTFVAAAEGAWEGIGRRAGLRAAAADTELAERTRRVAHRTSAVVDLAAQRVEHAVLAVAREAQRTLAGAEVATRRATDRLTASAGRATREPARRLDGVAAHLGALDPARLLARGWSITRRADGTLVRSAADAAVGDQLVTTLGVGAVTSRVEAQRHG
jgi:exodeoxyribonuclease VII large subunit